MKPLAMALHPEITLAKGRAIVEYLTDQEGSIDGITEIIHCFARTTPPPLIELLWFLDKFKENVSEMNP
jgi:hypothetical protein